MAANVNKVTILGTLGRDPELRSGGGTSFCTLNVATNSEFKTRSGEQKKETTWHRIECAGVTAENCAKYLKKGSQVYVEGRLRERSYEKDGQTRKVIEIIAANVQFLGGAPRSESKSEEESEDSPF